MENAFKQNTDVIQSDFKLGLYYNQAGDSCYVVGWDIPIPVIGGHELKISGVARNYYTQLHGLDAEYKYREYWNCYNRTFTLKPDTQFVVFSINQNYASTIKLTDITDGRVLFENGHIVKEDE